VAEVSKPGARLGDELGAKPSANVTNRVQDQDKYFSKWLGHSRTPSYFPARRTVATDQLERALERQKRAASNGSQCAHSTPLPESQSMDTRGLTRVGVSSSFKDKYTTIYSSTVRVSLSFLSLSYFLQCSGGRREGEGKAG
jgi:hypothetical protein